MNNHKCEKCGDEIDFGRESGPIGDYLHLCNCCEQKLRKQANAKNKSYGQRAALKSALHKCV